MPNDENAARADSDKQDAVIIDAQFLSRGEGQAVEGVPSAPRGKDGLK